MTQPGSAQRPLDNRAAGWWKSAVVYQIYPRSFVDSDGDGVGDLRGILGKLDYLAALGIDVLWVSPFFPSPMADNGYDISDYRGVDPLFGTMADVDELIEGLHQRGIYLMIDLVLNHTSEEHPWFRESRSSRDDPKRDWYWWRPPREGKTLGETGAEPTNWMGFFSESTWTPDEATGEYFLHIFTRHQPDLNWENPQVRAELYRMMRWWLDRGVDGFRMDVVNLVSKHTALQDGEPMPESRLSDGSPHFVCGPRIHEFMHELNQEVIAGRDKVVATVGEMPGVTTDHARRFSDPARAELDMVFQFEHMGVDHGPGGRYDPVPLDWVALKEVLGRWQDELGATGWNSLYWDNHDQPRAVSRFGDDNPGYRELSAKALATILHLQRGTPFIYQGEELGMTNYPFTSIEQINDVESRNFYTMATSNGASAAEAMAAVAVMSRDHGRTPMQWDDTPGAGFTSGTPWLPINPNHEQINVARQLSDPSSVLHYHRRLIELRHTLDVVAHGDFTVLVPEHPTLFAYLRRHNSGSLLVVANCSRDTVGAGDIRAALPGWRGDLLLANHDDPAMRADGHVAELGPWQARVYRGLE